MDPVSFLNKGAGRWSGGLGAEGKRREVTKMGKQKERAKEMKKGIKEGREVASRAMTIASSHPPPLPFRDSP